MVRFSPGTGVAVVAVAGLVGSPAASAQQSADELVAACTAHLDQFRYCDYRAEWTTRYRGRAFPAETEIEVLKIEYTVAGDRWRCLTNGTRLSPNRKGRPPQRTTDGMEWVTRRGGDLMIGRNDKGVADGLIASLGEVSGDGQQAVNNSPLRFLHGYSVDGSQANLPTVFKSAALTAGSDGPLRTVRAVGPWGEHTVWLDPARGHAISKLTVRKGPAHWMAPDKPLSAGKIGGVWRPKSSYSALAGTITVSDWATSGGVHYPAKYTFVEEEEFAAGGPPNRFERTVRVFNLRLGRDAAPDSALAVTTAIPDGMPVSIDGDTNVQYEWRAGQVVKAVDGEALAGMEGWEFRRGRPLRWVVVGGAAVAVAAVAGWLLVRRPTPQGGGLMRTVALFALLAAGGAPAQTTVAERNQSAGTAGSYCGLYAVHGALAAVGVRADFEALLDDRFLGSPEGSSLAELQAAVEAAGGHAVPVQRLTADALRAAEHPVVLHVRRPGFEAPFVHWLLFLGTSDDGQARVVDRPGRLEHWPFPVLLAHMDGAGLVVAAAPPGTGPLAAASWGRGLLAVGLTAGLLGLAGRLLRPRRLVGRLLVLAGAAGLAAAGWHAVAPDGFATNPEAVGWVRLRHFDQRPLAVTRDEVRDLLAGPGGAVLVDARPGPAFAAGHLPVAVNLPVTATLGEQEDAVRRHIPRHRPVVVYCQSEQCPWGEAVAATLLARGYPRVAVYPGGVNDWRRHDRLAR